MHWVFATPLATLADHMPCAVTVGDTELVLIRTGEQVFALASHCTHAEVELSGGCVADGEIECPAHGARFDLATGTPRCLPATRPLATYPTKIEGTDVYVALDR